MGEGACPAAGTRAQGLVVALAVNGELPGEMLGLPRSDEDYRLAVDSHPLEMRCRFRFYLFRFSQSPHCGGFSLNFIYFEW